MTPWPEAPVIRAFLARASRRLVWLGAAEGASGGLAVALLLVLVGWPTRGSVAPTVAIGVILALVGIAVRMLVPVGVRQRAEPVAWLVERRAPHCKNLVVTAAELIDEPTRVEPRIGAMICRDGARVAGTLDLAELFPSRRALTALGSSVALWAATVALEVRHSSPAPAGFGAATESASIAGVDVVVTPPSYTGRPSQSLHDPARIEALAGSRVHLTVRSNAAGVSIETIGGRETLGATASRTFAGDLSADADGYIAIEPAATNGRAGVRRLIGVSVTPDHPPRVKVTAPGRDLFIPDAHRSLELTVEADDDIGLASLTLRYTKVSGSGEQFKFTEGEVPLQVTRAGDRAWTARAKWPLDSLGLAAGDMVVYRGVAADRRPGAPPSESDSYIVQITDPGSVAAGGFAPDDSLDKYALSEEMVILKTSKLDSASKAMSPAALSDAALGLAAEQRSVRAVFVFMMGGELEDEVSDASAPGELHEEAEAEGESDLAAGRMANQGRIALVRGIRSMSQAATALTGADLTQALSDERAALVFLQGAFSRTRYILRALTEREALDLSRRLTGVLSAVLRDANPSVTPAAEPRVAALRAALSGIATLAGDTSGGFDASTQASVLAERVLRVDPSSQPLQQVAARLTEAAAAFAATPGAAGPGGTARGLLDRAATALASAVRSDLLDAPAQPVPLDLDRVGGALTDALRHPGGSP